MFHEVAKKLRRAGHTVRVSHLRNYRKRISEASCLETTEPVNRVEAERLGFTKADAAPRGGLTLITVIPSDGEFRPYVGGATCSNKDGYNKALGREIAMGRICKEFNILDLTS